MPASIGLVIGTILTVAGWVGLLAAAIHGRHMVNKLNTPPEQERHREPFDDQNGSRGNE